jgi:hypothetical protein
MSGVGGRRRFSDNKTLARSGGNGSWSFQVYFPKEIAYAAKMLPLKMRGERGVWLRVAIPIPAAKRNVTARNEAVSYHTGIALSERSPSSQ